MSARSIFIDWDSTVWPVRRPRLRSHDPDLESQHAQLGFGQCLRRPAPLRRRILAAPRAPCPWAGGWGANPRWLRILSITGRSMSAAMILSSPLPKFGQRCRAMSKTRLSSRAQLMRTGQTWAVWATHWTPQAATPGASSSLGGPSGTTRERSFAFGASTPWNRMRCSLGRGTSAASRYRNSSGPITWCVVKLKLCRADRAGTRADAGRPALTLYRRGGGVPRVFPGGQ